ncbi:hypothetical protein BU16DRAFT_45282 [Lophium mytilinum]|uniref:Uncharacterized protein n=1 Tax=Lophium mytilinum TaxID=390894 RepID=A0A6A6QQB4_9PEZI|nr:hypothetical protein BU16DRAFT_45282 [Lophium mytilinum]
MIFHFSHPHDFRFHQAAFTECVTTHTFGVCRVLPSRALFSFTGFTFGVYMACAGGGLMFLIVLFCALLKICFLIPNFRHTTAWLPTRLTSFFFFSSFPVSRDYWDSMGIIRHQARATVFLLFTCFAPSPHGWAVAGLAGARILHPVLCTITHPTFFSTFVLLWARTKRSERWLAIVFIPPLRNREEEVGEMGIGERSIITSSPLFIRGFG